MSAGAQQREVCLLLAQAESSGSIAAKLHIGHATAKDCADRIYRKLDVHTRDELLRKLRHAAPGSSSATHAGH